MRFSAAISSTCLAACIAVNAQAQPGVLKLFDKGAIDNWAQCSWEQMPVTAEALVSLGGSSTGIPKSDDIPFASREENLNARLNSVCGYLLSPSDLNAIGFGPPQAKKRALKEKRPETPGTEDKKISLFICAHKLSGRYVMTERGLPKPKPKRELSGASVDCFKLESDGSLSRA